MFSNHQAGDGSSIYMTENILCDGKADCGDARDEQQANCEKLDRFFYPGDGAPCDNNTKWIRSKNLCSGTSKILALSFCILHLLFSTGSGEDSRNVQF